MKTLPVLLLVLAFSAAAPAREWVLTYERRETRDFASPDGKIPARHESTAGTQIVVLGPGYLVVQEENKKTVYDFARGRMVSLALPELTYTDLPLCHFVDFLDAELVNRRVLDAAFRAAKLGPEKTLFNDYDSETSLHLVTPRGPPAPRPHIDMRALPDGTEFIHDDKVVVAYTPDPAALPPELQARFTNYLAYACAIHPQIRQVIAADGRPARKLEFHSHYLTISSDVALRLVSSVPADTDSSALPPEAKLAAFGTGPVEQALARVHAALESGQRPSRAQAVAFADAALKDHRTLDALLAVLEYTLQSGEPVAAEMRRLQPAIQADPSCQLYRKALDQSSKAACERSLAFLARIDRTQVRKAYMLDLQRACLLTLTGQPQQAVPLLAAVLQANPAHAGALHDLGAILARNFQQPLAWTCWDYALRLYPEHPMLVEITRREKELRLDFPEFF